MYESQPEEVVVAEPKISRKLFEEVLRASEALDSRLEVTLRSVRTSDSSEIASLTWSPTTFTLNKTDANSAAHVSSGLHQSISSQDPATVFALSEFYESVRENNKVVVRAKKVIAQKYKDLKRESEYNRKRPRASSPSPPPRPSPHRPSPPPTDEIAEASRPGRFWGS